MKGRFNTSILGSILLRVATVAAVVALYFSAPVRADAPCYIDCHQVMVPGIPGFWACENGDPEEDEGESGVVNCNNAMNPNGDCDWGDPEEQEDCEVGLPI